MKQNPAMNPPNPGEGSEFPPNEKPSIPPQEEPTTPDKDTPWKNPVDPDFPLEPETPPSTAPK